MDIIMFITFKMCKVNVVVTINIMKNYPNQGYYIHTLVPMSRMEALLLAKAQDGNTYNCIPISSSGVNIYF